MLAAGVLPLLGRRVDDHPRRPGATRMVAPGRDRRRLAHGSNQAEVVFLFDQWRGSPPLASLDRLLDESHGKAGAQSAHVDTAKATWPTRLWTLGQQYGGARILFVFDHFEQLLESAKENADAQQFVDEWIRTLKAPGLGTNFLVVLDDRAWPRLKQLGERVPGFDEVRVFELQARSGGPALEPSRAAGTERQAENSAEPEAVDFAASLRAMLSEFATSVRQTDPVPDDFQASVDALVFEVSRSARLEATPAEAEEDSRIDESIEAAKKADAVRAAEAQRVAQAQLAAEAARKAEVQRAAEAETMRIAEEAAAAEAKRAAEAAAAAEARRVAEELRKVEAERAAEAQRVAQAQRAAEAEAARKAEAQRAAAAEARRIAEEAAAVEAKRIAEAAAAAEARRIAEELRRVEAEQAAEAQRVAQAQRAAEAEAARRAEAQRAADAEAKRIAEAAAADEARRIAEVTNAAAAAKAKVIAEAVQLAANAARDSEARWLAGDNATRIESPSIAAASPGSPLRWAIKWGAATLAVMVVATLLWPSLRQRPAEPEAASPEALRTTPIAAAPATVLDAASAPIQAGAPSATAATASAPAATIPGAQPETTKPALFTVRMNAGGSNARIASELARAIGGDASSARAVATASGVDAVESLRTLRSLAIVQYDALRAARRSPSAPPLRVLAPMYAEEVVFIVRADSRLKFIHELRGRRINIGSARDGSAQTVREIYRQMFGTAMAEPSQLDKDKALAELVAFRSIDAMVLVDAQPSAWLASLSPETARGLRLLRLDRKQPEDRRVLKAFQTSVLRAGPGVKKGEGIPTLATMSYLAVSGKDDADSKQLTDMVSALCRELPRLRADGHPKWRELRPSVSQDTGWPVVASAQSVLKNCASASNGPAPALKPTLRRAPNSRSKR